MTYAKIVTIPLLTLFWQSFAISCYLLATSRHIESHDTE
jgi:hypothetical protein